MFKETLSFDDVLLQPKYSEIRSRSEVDLSVEFPKGYKFSHPFIPANMSSLISKDVLQLMYQSEGLSFLHRFMSIKEQLDLLQSIITQFGNNIYNYIGVSVGVKDYDYENVKKFIDIGVKIFLIDIAHLDSILGMDMIRYVAKECPNALLIAGNVATGTGAERAFRAGADVVKCGIGSGTICSTRLEAAAGVPQLSAIIEVNASRKALEKELNRKLSVISDGGIRTAGDCVKSLVFTDSVMLGGYFAGCEESPGEIIEINGQKMKPYHGSSTHKNSRIEGVKAAVKCKGSILDLIQKLKEGVQSGCSYQNSKNLTELKEDPTFIKISNAGLAESRIHDVIVSK